MKELTLKESMDRLNYLIDRLLKGGQMSLPLPPEFWHIDPDDVAVVIDGVTFIETKEEAARLVAEGRATYPEPEGCDSNP